MLRPILLLLLMFIDEQTTCLKSDNKTDLAEVSLKLLPFFRRHAEQDVDASSQVPGENEYPSKKILNFLFRNAKELLKPDDDNEKHKDTIKDLKTIIDPTNIKKILENIDNLPKREDEDDERRSLFLDGLEYGNSTIIQQNQGNAYNENEFNTNYKRRNLDTLQDQNNGDDFFDNTKTVQQSLKLNAKIRRKLKNLANAILANQKYIRDVAEDNAWNISNISIVDAGNRVTFIGNQESQTTYADIQRNQNNRENVPDTEKKVLDRVYALFKQEMKSRKKELLSNSSANKRLLGTNFETITDMVHKNSNPAENNNQKIPTVEFDCQEENLDNILHYPEYVDTKNDDILAIKKKNELFFNHQFSTKEMPLQIHPADEIDMESVTPTKFLPGFTYSSKKNNDSMQSFYNVSVYKLPFFKNFEGFELETTQAYSSEETTFLLNPKTIVNSEENSRSANVSYELLNNTLRDKIESDFDFITDNRKRSCIKCDNVAVDWCSAPKNKLIPSTICERANDLCYSLHTPFGIVDRGCYSTNQMHVYVCGCNMCNYIPFTDLPVKFTSKQDWIKNVYEISHLRSSRKTTRKNISCLNCTINATPKNSAIMDTNCLEGQLEHLNTVVCKQDEICGIKAIKNQGYIWRGCVKFPKYNYYMTFCDSDLCNYDPVASLYDIIITTDITDLYN